MPADVQINYGISSAHAQWISCRKVEQTIVTSSNDVTVISHAIRGGKYIRKASSSLSAVIWISGTEWLGPLLGHQPSTPAISVPLMEQEYILCTLFIHMHAPRLFGNTLVSMTLVVWQSGSSLPVSPWTQYQARHGSQPFAVDCIGRINHYFGGRAHQFI